MSDPMTADVPASDRALIEFAEKLTLSTHSMGPDDLNMLRDNGFDDRAIHDAVQVVALFNYYNRLAEGVGVRWVDEPDTESSS